MQEYLFRKFKYTTDISFSKSDNPARVTMYEDRFEIVTFNINYMGRFYIKSVEKQGMGVKVYRVCRILGEKSKSEIQQELEWEIELFFIQVTRFRNVIALYDKNNRGIILKR